MESSSGREHPAVSALRVVGLVSTSLAFGWKYPELAPWSLGAVLFMAVPAARAMLADVVTRKLPPQ